MGQKIHEYLLERFTFGDDDYYDIDYWDGATYQTAKIKGSTIKAGIQSGITGINVYNANGTLEGNRTIDGDAGTYALTLDNLSGFVVDNTGIFEAKIFPPSFLTTDKAINFEVDPTNISGAIPRLFQIKDSIANVRRFMVTTDGKIIVNEAYYLPNVDGNAGDVLTTDGAGVVTFQPVPTATNFYNSNGALTTNRIVAGSNNSLWFLDVNDYIFQTSNNLPTDNGVWFDIEEGNINLGGNLFRIRKKGGAGIGVDRFRVLKTGQIEINEEYKLPLNDGTTDQLLTTDGAGNVNFNDLSSLMASFYNHSSTQWSKIVPAPVTLADGSTANGFEFFTNADKSAGGTTSYDELSIGFTQTITLTGTSGTANINIDGTDYLATFNVDLGTTGDDFVTDWALDIKTNHNIVVVSDGAGLLKFGGFVEGIMQGITITNVTTDLSGTLGTTIGDHVRINYVGSAYEGQRLHHNFRVNFSASSSNQVRPAMLSLRRWADDSIIGSEIKAFRDSVEIGNQFNFITYTNDENDPFVTGGFYFALRNDTGTSLDITGSIGVLIQTYYQKPTKF